MGEQESTAAYPPGLYRMRDAETGEVRETVIGPATVAAMSPQGREDSRACARNLHRARDHLRAGIRREQPRKLHGARTPAARNREIAVGVLNPQNLIYGLSLALLVLIYLRSRSRPTIEVSSLMLFDEAPAPVASVRHVRIDPLFWLEMLTLAALTFAIAGLYVMRPPSPGPGRSHALVFDLGAGMSAHEGSGTRIDQARRQATRNNRSGSARRRVQRHRVCARSAGAASADCEPRRAAQGSRRPGSDGGASAHGGSESRADSCARRVGDRSVRRSPAPARDSRRRRLDGAREFSPGRFRRLQPGDRIAGSRRSGLDPRPRRDSQFLRQAASRRVGDRSRRQRAVPPDHDARAARAGGRLRSDRSRRAACCAREF